MDRCRTDVLSVKRGTRALVEIPVTQDLGGLDIDLDVHVLSGTEPGPVLSLLSTLHGSEWLSVEIIRRLLAQVDVSRLSGTVLALPVANPISLCLQTRCVPDESDSPDANRAFGTTNTWLADQLAQTIGREIIDKSDAMIDWHIMPWGAAMDASMYPIDLGDPELVEKSRQLAVAFGPGSIQRGKVMTEFPGPRSSFGYAGSVAGIPSIGCETGGLGWGHEVEEDWITRNVTGALNVMKHLGMLEGELEIPDKILMFDKRYRVNPRFGGMFMPERQPEQLLRRVEEGEVLGRIISANTFEELEVLRSPCPGYLYGIARFYAVRPGDWCFLIADASDDNTVWFDTGDM